MSENLRMLRPGTMYASNCDGSVEIEYPDGTGERLPPESVEARRFWEISAPLTPTCLGGCKGHPDAVTRSIVEIDRSNRVVTFE